MAPKANPNWQRKQATRKERETTKKREQQRNEKQQRYEKPTESRPKNLLYPTFHRSLLHSYSIPFAVGADCPMYSQCWFSQVVSSALIPSSRFIETVLTILHCGIHPIFYAPGISSRFNEMVLTIPCSPRPYLHPSLARQCSHEPYPRCLSSLLDRCILQVRFSQLYPPWVLSVPSKCTLVNCALLRCPTSVLLSSESTSLLLLRYYSVVVKKNEISPPWPFVWSTRCVPISACRQQAYALPSRRRTDRDCSRSCSSRTASGGRAVYLRWGCTSTSTIQDRAKCSITGCISCVNRYIERSAAEGRVGQAGDGPGGTGRAGGNGGDVRNDDGGSGGEFERACDGDCGGGGCGGGGGVETTRRPARA